MANNTLTVSELDFEGMVTSMVAFMRNYPQFKDYDFEGSNLRSLIDLLAYNTYINSFYTNMAINEMFLDTAAIRDSVISHAKELNYIPRSYRSSEAKIDITIYPNDAPSYIVIPKGTKFNGSNGQSVFGFVTDESIIVTPIGNTYSVSNVSIYEGSAVTEVFTVNTAIDNQRFILSNKNIDTTSLEVYVSNSIGGTEIWSNAPSLLGLDTTSKVYFLQAIGEKYEIIFGDNVVSASPANGARITTNYRICNGDSANGIKIFRSATPIGGYSNYTVTTTTNFNGSAISSTGGAQAESTKSIRLNAPRAYQTLERAVTADDYKTILFSKFPEIRAINVYGGEEVYPPQFGSVFIAVDVSNAVGLSDAEQNKLQSFILTKVPVSIYPVIIAPDYTYVKITTTVKYNQNITTLAPGDIQRFVLSEISNYNNNNLIDFNATLRYSKLVSAIDNGDVSIVSNNTKVQIFKNFVPYLNGPYHISLTYQNGLTEGTVTSTSFTYRNTPCTLADDGAGKMQIITYLSGVKTVVNPSIGTVNYVTGEIILDNFNISAFEGNYVSVFATTAENDFSSSLNTILSIDLSQVSVTATGVRV